MTIGDSCFDHIVSLNGEITIEAVDQFLNDVLEYMKDGGDSPLHRALLDAATTFLLEPEERWNAAWLVVLAEAYVNSEAFLLDMERNPRPLSWPMNMSRDEVTCRREVAQSRRKLEQLEFYKNNKGVRMMYRDLLALSEAHLAKLKSAPPPVASEAADQKKEAL